MSHTPGPWSVKPSVDAIEIVDANERAVASVSDRMIIWDGIPPDNASLIAAAPELLEALKELVSSVNATMNSMESAGVKIPFVPCEILLVTLKDEVLEAEAAIAKAEGRTK